MPQKHEPFDFERLRPADTPEFMTPAWIGCISWAVGNEDIVAAFRADTGFNWSPGRTPIDQMVDEAAGMNEKFTEAFVLWVNENVWGPVNPEPATETI